MTSSGLLTSSSQVPAYTITSVSEEEKERMLNYISDIFKLSYPHLPAATAESSLQSLGLTSTEVVQLKNVIAAELNVVVPTIAVFEAQTMRDLANRLALIFANRTTAEEADLSSSRSSDDSFTRTSSLSSVARFYVIMCRIRGIGEPHSKTIKIPLTEGHLPSEGEFLQFVAEKLGQPLSDISVLHSETFNAVRFPLSIIEDLPNTLLVAPRSWVEFAEPPQYKPDPGLAKKILQKLKKGVPPLKAFTAFLHNLVPAAFSHIKSDALTPDTSVSSLLNFEQLKELRSAVSFSLQCVVPLLLFTEPSTFGDIANALRAFFVRNRELHTNARHSFKAAKSSSSPKTPMRVSAVYEEEGAQESSYL